MSTTPVLTERVDFRHLMTHEFHDLAGNFDAVEPEAYIQRLAQSQIDLLNDDAQTPLNRLICLIILGDGVIDLPIGGDYTILNDPFSVRPNASFALFYKTRSGALKIELVFYTRFFTVSYGTVAGDPAKFMKRDLNRLDEASNRVLRPARSRRRFNKPDDDDYRISDTAQRERLFRDVFRHMLGIPSAGNFADIDPSARPKRKANQGIFKYRLVVKDEAEYGVRDAYFPYIQLEHGYKISKRGRPDRYKWEIPPWFKGNFIHGVYNTKGCWMLMRNQLWDWPEENVGSENPSPPPKSRFQQGSSRSNYEKVAQCYLMYRKGSTGISDSDGSTIRDYLISIHSSPARFPDDSFVFPYLDRDFDNYASLDFLRYFAGAGFSLRGDVPRRPQMEFRVKSVVSNQIFQIERLFPFALIPGRDDVLTIDQYFRGEPIEIRGETAEITVFNGSNQMVEVDSWSAPISVTVGDRVDLANAWTPGPLTYNLDAFGRPGSKNFADVFLFRRAPTPDRGFTGFRNDLRKFT